MNNALARAKIESAENWLEWSRKIPEIQFPRSWKVTIIPPFAGAMVRFVVTTPNAKRVSVYLDCYDNLGCFGSPYWEVYPVDDDTYRVKMEDVEGLLRGIKKAGSL